MMPICSVFLSLKEIYCISQFKYLVVQKPGYPDSYMEFQEVSYVR